MPYNIVVGVDGSASSADALRWAIEEARLRDAELTVLFAWQLPLIGIPGAFNRADLEQGARRLLAEEIAAVDPPGDVSINELVAEGDPSESLMAACDQLGADLLVLGSRGRGGFKALRLGSVGQECAVHADCPVLIVKNGDRAD